MAWHNNLYLVAVEIVHVLGFLSTAAMGTTTSVLLFWTPIREKMTNFWMLFKSPMADVAQRFCTGKRGVAEANFLGYGRIVFINR